MRRTPIAVLLILLGVAIGESRVSAASAPGGRPGRLEPLDIRKEPAPADWRYFLKATDADRAKLWTYHENLGVKLSGWAWGWRLGWVRACGDSDSLLCQDILRQALFDKALVVRAEAATRFGRRFEGSSDHNVITLLSRAYADPRNMRGGKPLYVQSRILFALHRVGGDEAVQAGKRLSLSHPDAKSYWARLKAAGE